MPLVVDVGLGLHPFGEGLRFGLESATSDSEAILAVAEQKCFAACRVDTCETVPAVELPIRFLVEMIKRKPSGKRVPSRFSSCLRAAKYEVASIVVDSFLVLLCSDARAEARTV
jgi:hypothetical protein